MERPLARAWAPGRVNLIGEHTDYSGGLVLPAAIQLGVGVDVLERSDDVTLVSTRFGGTASFAADGGGGPTEGWARYGQAVAAELAALGRPAVGLVGRIDADLPPRAGLSSSAALEVAIALALCAVAGFEVERLELALACRRAEERAVGVPVGILDQAASLLGREGEAILLDCGTLEHRRVLVPAGAALLVVDSGVERSLEGTEYGRRASELQRALELAGAARSTELHESAVAGVEGVSARRLRHVVTENARVRLLAAALETGDLAEAGRLVSASHASLRDDYEVSTPELDLLVELALGAGALGARLLGAGFGGSVLVLVESDRAETVAARVLDGYRERTGRTSWAIAVRPSAGARMVA